MSEEALLNMDCDCVQWSGIGESLSQFSFHLILWGQIQLLEEFRRNGNATRRMDLPQSSVFVFAMVQVLMIAFKVSMMEYTYQDKLRTIGVGEVLLECIVVVCHSGERAVRS